MHNDNVIALYIRLSLEDENEGESNSVKNQRDLLNQYLDKHSELFSYRRIEFCDDGYSGTNFNRPNMTQLLDKARKQEISAIIVKDFSRFGRSYIEVGSFLEEVFPFLGIRFISINDNFDSKTQAAGDISIALRSLINDLYSKDLSAKCKSGKLAKMKRGEFINPYAPYGFVKSAENKNKLEIDPEAAEIVRFIFDLAAKGENQTEIARTLNQKGVLSPNEYKAKRNDGRDWATATTRSTIWSKSAVYRILRDERYTGVMVARKFERLVVGNPNTLKSFSQDDWIIVPNTHEAIISKAVFDEVQLIFKSRPQTPKKEKRVLAGKVRCYYCNRALHRQSRKDGGYYHCPTTKLTDAPSCFDGRISERLILDAVLSTVQAHTALFIEIEMKSKTHGKTALNQISQLSEQINYHQADIEKLGILKKELYESYKDDHISKDDYFAKREQLNREIESISTNTDALQVEMQKAKLLVNNSQTSSPWKKTIGIAELNRDIMEELVDVIIVHSDEGLEIRLKHADGFVVGGL